MTDKRYADMVAIMQFSRIYTEQMHKCLKDSGMLDEGYHLRMWVGNFVGNDDIMKATIELENNTFEIGTEEWHKSRMDQEMFEERGWFVSADPKTEIGGIPPEIRIDNRTKDRVERKGKTGEKPYPPDGLWISSRYDPSDVDSGV